MNNFFIFAASMRRTCVTPISDSGKLKEFLNARSMKATPQRLAVHEALCALGHASAEEIAGYISKQTDKVITVASIYNILNQFTELGICAARLSPGNKKIFDFNTCPHIHLYDSSSHTMKDLADNGIVETVQNLLKKRRFPGYKLDSIELVLVCHQKKKKRTRL